MIEVTGLVLTYNEAPNLARTLGRLTWLREIIVIDSGSDDGTREIAARFPNVRVVVRPFTTHAEQWTFGLEQTGQAPWVLALDADYVLSDAVVREIQALDPPAAVGGYEAAFDYCIEGRPLRGAAYPPVTVLFRRAGARYEQDGHTQRVRIEGETRPLAGRIAHDDRKPLGHWLSAQARYMALEADKLATAPVRTLSPGDRVRRAIVIAPPAMFLYCYLLRGGVLDGKAGLYYALQRAAAELILSLYLVRRMVGGPGASPG